MDRSLLLAGISAAQLGAGLAGLAVAVRRRHPYAFLVLRGDPDRIALDAIDIGTALSAPGVMLVAQATATAHLLRRRASLAERILGALGAAMMVGYLGEDLVRRRLRRSNWDRLESPLIAVGFGLASAMAVVGLRKRDQARFEAR